MLKVTKLPTEKPIKWIGFICNVNNMKPLDLHLGTPYWIMRIITMENILYKHNHKLFVYSHADVDLQKMTVKGYYFLNKQLVSIELPVPKINYDYYFGKSNSTALLREFIKIGATQSIQVYNRLEFTLLSRDKYKTHQLFLQINKDLLPDTILLDKDNLQLNELSKNYPILFIKPRFGNMGNGIIIIKKNRQGFCTFFHTNMKTITNIFDNIEQLESYILSLVIDNKYIIQQGIDCLKINDSAFDIRVSMLNDSSRWHSIHLVRVGAANSDLSNLSQGGRVLETHEALSQLFSPHKTKQIISNVENLSVEIMKCLNQTHANDLLEITLDYILDKDGKIYLAEINTKPGLSGIPQFYVDGFLNMTAKEQHVYENYSMPHGRYLAEFLLQKSVACTIS